LLGTVNSHDQQLLQLDALAELIAEPIVEFVISRTADHRPAQNTEGVHKFVRKHDETRRLLNPVTPGPGVFAPVMVKKWKVARSPLEKANSTCTSPPDTLLSGIREVSCGTRTTFLAGCWIPRSSISPVRRLAESLPEPSE
jgi:hypothetical protein